jgi:hypothetical protein
VLIEKRSTRLGRVSGRSRINWLVNGIVPVCCMMLLNIERVALSLKFLEHVERPVKQCGVTARQDHGVFCPSLERLDLSSSAADRQDEALSVGFCAAASARNRLEGADPADRSLSIAQRSREEDDGRLHRNCS